MDKSLQVLQNEVASIARDVGGLVLDHYHHHNFTIADKEDQSPVTSADIAASEFIIQALGKLTPDIPILSEEAIVPWSKRRHWQRYWLIDPIDGTQEFIDGSGDFAIAIALVENFQPVLGCIYWPTQKVLYQAAHGHGAQRIAVPQSSGMGRAQSIKVRQLKDPLEDELIIAVSRRQSEGKVLSRMNPARQLKSIMTGSCSLKSCLVAEGSADCFLRVGPTGEWDTGAAQIIVEEAGGSLLSEHFAPVTYNRTASLANPNFIVLGDQRVNWMSVFPGQFKA